MEKLELACFQIISFAGEARSDYIEAIQHAKRGEIDIAQSILDKGKSFYLQAHKVHATLLQAEANKEIQELTLLLIHAEDQLITTEMMYTTAIEMIEMIKRLNFIERSLKVSSIAD